MIIADTEIQRLVAQQNNPLLTGFDQPSNWMGKDSLVQPCSLDLHIGSIYQPGCKRGKSGSAGNPSTELVLETGQTAVVATQETLHLPSDIAGFGFPPSHISSRALLMTNPGHVDPGYSGQLQFTVINMGREPYVLRAKDLIVTLLLFRLATPSAADYAARRAAPAIFQIKQTEIDRLSPDFIDVQRRAKAIAIRTLGITTGVVTVVTLIVSLATNTFEKHMDGIDEMKARLTRVEEQNKSLANDLSNTRVQLLKEMDLDHRLLLVEAQVKTGKPSRDGRGAAAK